MNDFDPLEQFTVRRRTGELDLELTCDECSAVVCGIQAGSSLATLANTADAHWRENHARP